MDNKTRLLELLANHGELTITKKSGEYIATFIQKDKNGILTNPISEWGSDLSEVLQKLASRITATV